MVCPCTQQWCVKTIPNGRAISSSCHNEVSLTARSGLLNLRSLICSRQATVILHLRALQSPQTSASGTDLISQAIQPAVWLQSNYTKWLQKCIQRQFHLLITKKQANTVLPLTCISSVLTDFAEHLQKTEA